MEFYMLGVIHRDEEGPSLLREWLCSIRPSIITVEISKYGINFRKQFGAYYKERILKLIETNIEDFSDSMKKTTTDLMNYFDIPYEYKIAEEYVNKHGGKIYPVDMGLFSYVHLQSIAKNLDRGKIDVLFGNGIASDSKKERFKAFMFFQRGIKTFEYTKEMYVRDKFMARKIRSLMNSLNFNKFSHICGWQHLSDPFGIFDPFQPKKIFVYDRTCGF